MPSKNPAKKAVINDKEGKAQPQRASLDIGPKTTDSFWTRMLRSRNRTFKVNLGGGITYEGCLLDGQFNGRGKLM
jgi:hypothetical protein